MVLGKGKKPGVKRPPWQNDFSPAPLEDHSNNFQPGQIGVLTLEATAKTETDRCPAEIRLLPGSIKVGRDHKKCSEVFGSNAVSGTHCEIIVKSASMVTIEDSKSTNGTYVNDTKIKTSVSLDRIPSIWRLTALATGHTAQRRLRVLRHPRLPLRGDYPQGRPVERTWRTAQTFDGEWRPQASCPEQAIRCSSSTPWVCRWRCPRSRSQAELSSW